MEGYINLLTYIFKSCKPLFSYNLRFSVTMFIYVSSPRLRDWYFKLSAKHDISLSTYLFISRDIQCNMPKWLRSIKWQMKSVVLRGTFDLAHLNSPKRNMHKSTVKISHKTNSQPVSHHRHCQSVSHHRQYYYCHYYSYYIIWQY